MLLVSSLILPVAGVTAMAATPASSCSGTGSALTGRLPRAVPWRMPAGGAFEFMAGFDWFRFGWFHGWFVVGCDPADRRRCGDWVGDNIRTIVEILK